MSDAASILDALVGSTTPGGCEHCNAEQRMTKDGAGIYHLTVEHDDWCPFLRAYEGRS